MARTKQAARKKKNNNKNIWQQDRDDPLKQGCKKDKSQGAELLKKYYKGINLVPDAEWDQFITTLQIPLPAAFRITEFRSQAQDLLKLIKSEYFSQLATADIKKQENQSSDEVTKVEPATETEAVQMEQPEAETVKIEPATETEAVKMEQPETETVKIEPATETEAVKMEQSETETVKIEPATEGDTVKMELAAEAVKMESGSDRMESVCDKVNVQIDPPKCLSWYPNEMAWQLDLNRQVIRKSQRFRKLHDFLVSETASGNITRQEAVSMIPPCVMDIQPHHKVLDMCAAPGSKTSQILEFLNQRATADNPATGFVVANDMNNKRCYLMVHQVKRLYSPNFVVTNHDATRIPNFRMTPQDEPAEWLKFDRILADVPCSGDGTMRKNPDAWWKWNPSNAINLHNIQKQILQRGVNLLEVGGRIVYSTCSMNPVEDEAVVASILKECEGSLELLDVSSEVPGLKHIPGMTTWKLMHRNGEDWYSDFETLPSNMVSQMRPSMFPPTPEEAEAMKLTRCIRVLPHHQNTGGFFVAVLKKVEKAPVLGQYKGRKAAQAWAEKSPQATSSNNEGALENKEELSSNQAEVPNSEEASSNKEVVETEGSTLKFNDRPGNKRKLEDGEEEGLIQRRPRRHDGRKRHKGNIEFKGFWEDPFVFLKKDDAIWPPIKKFYGITDSFPNDQLMVRNTDGKRRTLYFTSLEVKKLAECNPLRIKFINMGVKVFSRSESVRVDCSFRLNQEGLGTITPYTQERHLKISADDVVGLLSHENPFIDNLSAQFRTQMFSLGEGGVSFIYEPVKGEKGPSSPIVLCGWRGKVSCRAYMPKHERAHYLRICGVSIEGEDWRPEQSKGATNDDIPQEEEEKPEVPEDDNNDEEEDNAMN